MKIKIICVLGLMFCLSCSGPQPDIQIDKFAQIVYQVHRADAIIEIANLEDKNLKNDSLSYYNGLFANLGITRREFIEEIEWYTQHPDKYLELCEKVMKIIAEEERKAEEEELAGANAEKDSSNIWTMKKDWHLPLDGATNPIAFEYMVTQQGVYTLSAEVIYYSDDKTVNPRMTIIANYEDGTNEQNAFWGIQRDGQKYSMEVKIKTDPNKTLKTISGWVLDHSDGTESKHIDVYGITLKYSLE
ncbi:MAG: DUF4296 domain-containing protein [Bacteroidales bacterium]|nr:DUF4296 domain-containing protein [Bacteroidales bacterium]